MCSYFNQTRIGNYIPRMYAKFASQYPLVSLYESFYINSEPNATLNNVNYSEIDPKIIGKIANYLKDCQDNN